MTFKEVYKFPLKVDDYCPIITWTADKQRAFDWCVNISLEKQQELIAEANSKAKESRKAHDSVEELKKRYEELRNRIILTEDEQEEYNKIIEQIVNEFPELIDSYNTVTNELTVQSEKWDEILEKQKQSKILAEGNARYLKLSFEKAFNSSSSFHEEMCYEIPVDLTEIDFPEKPQK